MRAGALWRDREFLKLWSGQTISQVGSRITRDGLPYTAVLMLHAGPMQMGLLAALGGIAALVAGPVAGVLADRYRRRPILIWADLGRAAVLSVIPLAAATHQLQFWHLYLATALAGALDHPIRLRVSVLLAHAGPPGPVAGRQSQAGAEQLHGGSAGPGHDRLPGRRR